MNIKPIIFSGIIMALIGAMIGLGVAHVAHRELRTKKIIIGGATLGFAIGVLQQAVREQKEQIDEYTQSDKRK